MNRRTQAAYEAVFQFINAKVFDLSGTKKFITDFELALRNALSSKYPSASFTACAFHFAQAIYKHAKKINGFLEFIRHNDKVKKIFYKLLYINLLPPIQIDLLFNQLRKEAEEIDDPKLNSFINYFRRQWILKEGSWRITVFGDEVRTTSPAEGYNRALNDYCQKKGSFIWFCFSIRNQEFMKSKEFISFVESGGLIGCQQRKEDKVNQLNL